MSLRHSSAISALPSPQNEDGETRLLGVEVEFGGLTEGRAAEILAGMTDRDVTQGDEEYRVEDTPFGTCKLYMDTAYRNQDDTALGRAALDLARNVVPVELVTSPFPPDRLGKLDEVLARYRAAGASGTHGGILLGFGVHLNVQIAAPTAAHLWSVTTAFAMAEPLLRDAYDLDMSRRALPFVDPYPQRLLDVLAQGCPERLDTLVESYLGATHSRNHALDMLPIFAHLCPDLTRDALARGAGAPSRPGPPITTACPIAVSTSQAGAWPANGPCGAPWNGWLRIATRWRRSAPAGGRCAKTRWNGCACS